MSEFAERRPVTRVSTNDVGYTEHLASAIQSATERVWLKVPWIGPLGRGPGRLISKVEEATRRGVDIRLLLRPEASNTATLQHLTSRGIPHRTIRYLHEKEMLVDDRLIVFSANFTPTELERNDNHAYEISAIGDIEAAESAFLSQWLLPEVEANAGEEQWIPVESVVPKSLLQLIGRTKLNPLQAKVLPVVFGTDAAIVVTAPTGSGKTTVGEAAALKSIRLQNKKAVYLTPSRALTRELHGTFARWKASGIRIAILSGDIDVDMDSVARSDLWVCTTEKFESAFRRSSMAEAIADVGCVVVDEIHTLGDPNRGPLLEALLARLRLLAARTRLVGLSATVANDQQLADWLNAQLMQSSWRPSRLTVQVLGYDSKPKWLDNESAKDRASQPIVDDVSSSGGSVIVFCGSKPKAKHVAAELASVPVGDDDEALARLALDKGVGLHYRGLSTLKEAEKKFRERRISRLVATSGLAQGVNLPARAVLIRDTTLGKEPLSVGDALQMAGRAGRVGLEAAGFAFLLVPRDEVSQWRTKLLEGHAVRSHLGESLADHVLAEVLLDRIRSAQTMREWFAGTFAAHQGGLSRSESDGLLDKAMALLNDCGLVTVASDGDTVTCTDLGALTSRFLIDVHSAAAILRQLPGEDPTSADEAEAHVLTTVAGAALPFATAFASQTLVDFGLSILPSETVRMLGNAPKAGTVKTLTAAHVALTEPGRLSRSGRIADTSTTDLRDIADDLARHLAWLASLGTASWLAWVPAVANDLAARIRWEAAQPPRGSGRILRLLERRIPADQQRQRIPNEFRRVAHQPDAIIELATASGSQSALPLVDISIDVSVGDESLETRPMIDNTDALPVRMIAATRFGVEHTSSATERWDGGALVMGIPESAAPRGEVVVEALAYGRIDWDWTFRRVSFPPRSSDPLNSVSLAISELPSSVFVLPKRRSIFGRRTWTKRVAEAAIDGSRELRPIALAASGSGNDHRRAWRLAETMRALVSVVDSEQHITTPLVALRNGQCDMSSWALCYAALCRQIGFETGVVNDRSSGGLVAIVRIDGEWHLVLVDATLMPASTSPVVPSTLRGNLTALQIPSPEPSPGRPEPTWGFLASYRSPHQSGTASVSSRLQSTRREESNSGAAPRPHKAIVRQHGHSQVNHASASRPESTPYDAPSDVSLAARAIHEARIPGLFDKHPRAYALWTDAEDRHLTMLVEKGLTVTELVHLHGRQPGAIRSRLRKLGLSKTT